LFIFSRENIIIIHVIQTSFKLIKHQNVIRSLFGLIVIFSVSVTYAQEANSLSSSIDLQTSDSFEQSLLNQAVSFRVSDRAKSIELAIRALEASKEKNNHNVSAQVHTLLGELVLDDNKVTQSMEHFLAASIIYRDMKDERYEYVDKMIDELLPVAKQYEVTWPTALVLIKQADSDYNNKHYEDAIKYYFHAVNYLGSPTKSIQKKLAQTYKKIAQSYKRLKNREQTALYYKKTLDVFTAIQDKKNMARTLNTLAEAERYLGNYFTALDYSVRSLEIHKQIDDPEGRAKAFNGAGIIYRYIGRYEKALEHAYEAHLYYKQVKDFSGIAKTSNQMGLIYTRLKQFEQARSFYQLTIDLPENKIEPKTLASALREMAVIELDVKHYDAAMKLIKKAYKIYQEENNKSNQSLVERIIANIYRAQKNSQQAIIYYRKSLSSAIDAGSEVAQLKAQIPLGTNLLGKDNDEAIRLLESALALSLKAKMTSYQLYAYRELRKAEKKRGNFAVSLGYAEKEIKLSGTLQKEKDDDEMVLVKAKLYSHKKEMELESLKEKAKLDQLDLAKKSSEVEIAEQRRRISELELIENQYANFALACLLVVCLLVVLFIYRGFSTSRKRNKELDYLACHDPLTNCYNRRVLFDFLERDFSDLASLGEYCLIMLDIDHFKEVNDTYGHIIGDKVLCRLANLLRDKVNDRDSVVRFGGEEFCLIIPGATPKEGVKMAEIIRQKVEHSDFDNISITCSFGVTSIQFNATSPTELVHQADLALYKSKVDGRNKVTLWDNDE